MRRIPAALAAALVLLTVLALILLSVVNGAVLPAAVERLEVAAGSALDWDLSIGSARLRPLRGVHLRDIRLSTADAALRSTVESVDVDTDLRGLLRLRRAARTPASIDTATAWTLLEDLAGRRLVPNAVRAHDVDIVIAETASSQAYRLRFDALRLLHDHDGAVVRLQARGSPRRGVSAGSPPQAMSAEVAAAYGSRTAEVTLELDRVELPRLSLPSAALLAGATSASLSAEISPTGTTKLTGTVSLHNLAVEAPVVAPGTIRPLDISYRFAADYAPRRVSEDIPHSVPASIRRSFPRGELTISEGAASINGIDFGLTGLLRGVRSDAAHPASRAPAFLPRRLRLRLDLPPTSASRIHAAVPRALRGPLDTMEPAGSFRWKLDLDMPRYNPGGLRWEAETELRDFDVLHIDESLSPFGLNDAFVHTIHDPEIGYTRRVRIPPAASPADPPTASPADRREEAGASGGGRTAPPADSNSTYVRLDDMSPWVPRAVLTAEDGEFYTHNGVNFRTMAQAVVRNLDAGGVVLGASTISMQLVKMLFLDDDRIFSRKLQEVFLVFLMEHEVPVPKDRILEIYLNIAEFGPAVFGIQEAARYYFDTEAADLTAGEAMFLASILPAPKRYHWYFERGGITDGWFIRMQSYYDVMLKRDRMTPEEYAEAMRTVPQFAGYRDR
ncbi:MAG: transglycosylase domain-containing protein [Spirochaetaceae bacterium]